ncbi:radical SAM protein [bacterium SCSIO 12643]|nr:radical SAM protein [bacterium SCSIO 12643]
MDQNGIKVLFLNPPGKEIYIRDYYCSKVSKAYYLPQPVDLVIQSSFFNGPNFECLVCDAIAEKLSIPQTIDMAVGFQPELIITQCGSVSIEEDETFFKMLNHKLPKAKILSTGDLFLENATEYLKETDWLDGIITDFFDSGPLHFILNNPEEINGLTYKSNGGIITRPSSKQTKGIELAVPQHHLFKNELYRMPFANKYPMATVLTNYACPYPCTFCIMSFLNFKQRSAESVKQELLQLKDLGVKYLYFSDQTFYKNNKVTSEILDFMISENFGFNWVCFSRVDVLDVKKLQKMKAAGCNTIMFGVEWAEDDLCDKYKKQYTTAQVRATFELVKKVGIKRMGTFLIGVPGQTEASIRNTVDFAIEIDADYASFNVAVPRVQTSFREEALEMGLITDNQKEMDQSGSFIAMGTGEVSAEGLMRLKKEAYRRFYLRPGYIWKRVYALKNWEELKTHTREAYFVVKNIFS